MPLLGAVFLAGFAACSSGSGDAADGSTSRPAARESTPSSTIPAKDRAEVLRDYNAFWRALFAAGDPPDPNDPELLKYATGQELLDVQEVLGTAAAGGYVRRGSQQLKPEILEVNAQSATVRDCYRNNWLLYALPGNSAGAPPGSAVEEPTGPQLRIVTLTRDGDGWKVSGVGPPLAEQRSCGSLKQEQRVLSAYERYERVLYAVFSKDNPSPNDPRLKEVLAKGHPELTGVQDDIRQDQGLGIVRRRASPRGHERAEITAFASNESALVQTCLVDDGTQHPVPKDLPFPHALTHSVPVQSCVYCQCLPARGEAEPSRCPVASSAEKSGSAAQTARTVRVCDA
jgi:hypothetical protein